MKKAKPLPLIKNMLNSLTHQRKLLFLIVSLFLQYTVAGQGYYPDLVSDISSNLPNSNVSVTQLIDAFNAVRQQENTQLGTALGTITAPTQAAWDAMNEKQQLYWLLNQERQLRGLKPLEELNTASLGNITQSYADLMMQKNEFSHTVGGTSPFDRMNSDPAIKNCNQSEGENIYISWNYQYNNHGVVDALLSWMYSDTGSGWGHRRFLLKKDFNDDSGVAGKEGVVAFGISKGVWGTWQATTVVVYDCFDPCATWQFNNSNNLYPVVTINSPLNNGQYSSPANITIDVSATDQDGSIAKVEYFNGTQKLGEVSSAPYTFSWTNVQPGSYQITVTATDNLGAQSSKQVTIKVTDPNAVATVYQHCDYNTAGYGIDLAPGNYTLANLTAKGIKDNDISSLKVQAGYQVILYADDNFLGTSLTINSNNTCLVSNNFNDKATSIIVRKIPANTPPVVSISSPASGTSFNAPANISISANATDTDGTIAKVEFLNGTQVIGTATVAPYQATWANVAAGSYTITVKATDNSGGVATATVSVQVVNPTPKVATIYKHCNYDLSGYAIQLEAGNYTTAQLIARGISDNDVSSIKLQSGYQIILYQGDNFTGTSITLTGNISCLVSNSFNDQTSSLKIQAVAAIMPTARVASMVSVTNPVESGVTIEFESAVTSEAEVSIYNSLGYAYKVGAKVRSGEYIDMSSMEGGIYILVVKMGDEIQTKRIMKQ